jgi:NIMA (never in mitosis gene a)-related kinase
MKTVKNVTIGEDKKHQIEALQEVKILEKLDHPNIVAFREAFLSADGRALYIIMSYCESGDLEQRIQAARRRAQYFSENQIIDWILQIAMALKYLHARHILHRDLKPQNIFLTESNTVVKLGDFGIVKLLEDTTAMAVTKVGTPYYFSPELCRSKPYSYKSDVWAVGVLSYQLMCLCVPFDARSMPELIRKVLYSMEYTVLYSTGAVYYQLIRKVH